MAETENADAKEDSKPPQSTEAVDDAAEPTAGADGELSAEEKTWGMLAHLLSFLGAVGVPFGSLIGPAIAYFLHKDKSKFVRFHALQSFAFQLCLGIIGVLLVIPFFILYVLTMGLILLIAIPLAIFLIVYVIRIALKANEGQCVRYYYIGDWVYKRVYEEDWKPF